MNGRTRKASQLSTILFNESLEDVTNEIREELAEELARTVGFGLEGIEQSLIDDSDYSHSKSEESESTLDYSSDDEAPFDFDVYSDRDSEVSQSDEEIENSYKEELSSELLAEARKEEEWANLNLASMENQKEEREINRLRDAENTQKQTAKAWREFKKGGAFKAVKPIDWNSTYPSAHFALLFKVKTENHHDKKDLQTVNLKTHQQNAESQNSQNTHPYEGDFIVRTHCRKPKSQFDKMQLDKKYPNSEDFVLQPRPGKRR